MVIPVESYVINSEYDPNFLTSDLAVVKLSQSVQYTGKRCGIWQTFFSLFFILDKIRAAELPNADDFVDGGVNVWISGYGAINDGTILN